MNKLNWLLLIVIGCSEVKPDAQSIMDRGMEKAGIAQLEQAQASFVFRDYAYTYSMDNGIFEYTRSKSDSVGIVTRDVLTNEGLNRFVGDSLVNLDSLKEQAYTSSVNSVIYFAFLPHRLNDDAVIKTYAGNVEINGKLYHKVKVTFDADGGGEDFEDVFYYWFDIEDYSMDYLAYSYNEEEGKGMRMRVAYNQRTINGVAIQDYINLKPAVPESIALENIDQAFIDNQLVELSRIELTDMIITN